MGELPPCVYRDMSDEAYRLSSPGKHERIDVWLCSWPTTLGPTPRWVRRSIGFGLAITPEHDCRNCPCQTATLPRGAP